MSDIDRAIEAARLRYWSLIRRKAQALGKSEGLVLAEEVATVKDDGRVYMHGKLVGQQKPPQRPGWTTMGIEAAGPPFNPPMNPVKDFEGVKAAYERKAAGDPSRLVTFGNDDREGA